MKKAKRSKLFRFLLTALIIAPTFIFSLSASLNYCLADATDPIYYQPQVSIPGSDFQAGVANKLDARDTSYIAKYVTAFYNYGLGLVGIIGVIVLMIGGIIWLTSAGNPNQVGQAKDLIIGSLSGIALLLVSWVLLNTINPNLVNFKITSIGYLANNPSAPSSCADYLTEADCGTASWCAWKDNTCVGKIIAGLAKCSDKKEEIPAPAICCCQSNPLNGEFVYCKWATYVGLDAQGGGSCGACGDTYTKVPEGKEYICENTPPETPSDPIANDCQDKAEKTSCRQGEYVDMQGQQVIVSYNGYCANKKCEKCVQPKGECGNFNSTNYLCANTKDGVCGTDVQHGDCKLKLNSPNICVDGDQSGE